jgi:membrane associated rhomboid family serine protease
MFPIRDRAPTKGFPLVTILLILVNIYFFQAELFAPNPDLFILQYALIPQLIDFSNFSSLIPFLTAQFLHAGFLHIVSNMWFLWIFGDNVEAKMGKVPFLIFYLFAGIIGFFVQYLFLADSQIPMLGASASVAGVLGAYLVFFPKARVDVLVPFFPLFFTIALPTTTMLFYWFFIQLFNGVAMIVTETAAVGGVAYWAHIGGFGAGYLLAHLFSSPHPKR